VERNAMVYRRTWLVIVSGFFEPLFYLLSIGVGIGRLVGDITWDGGTVAYTTFVAPALLASSAMNGAVFDSTFNVFHKLKYAKVYDAVLATPLQVRDVAVGEITWAVVRGQLYAVTFLVLMAVSGLTESWWAVAAFPACVLIGFCFASLGMASTAYMRTWTDFEWTALVTTSLFLFSATFYPLETYPGWLQAVTQISPLYHGVALVRDCTLGTVGWGALVHVGYLLLLTAGGLTVARTRLARLLVT
jgi:lipooligosaccharide transport system permease protein